MALVIVAGFVLLTIPVLTFYAYNDALDDLFRVYFGYNLGGYGNLNDRCEYSAISHFMCLSILISNNVIVALLVTISFLNVLSLKNNIIYTYFLLLTFPVLTILMVGVYWNQYFLPLTVFSIIAIYIICDKSITILNLTNHTVRKCILVCFSILFAMCVIGSEHLRTIFTDKESIPYFRFAKIINHKHNPTLLEYGDKSSNFRSYTASRVVPTCYYFSLISAFDSDIQIAYQDSMVNEGAFDFLVASRGDLKFDYYTPIDSLDGYYLYKHK